MKKGIKRFHENETMGSLLTMAIHDVSDQVKKGIILDMDNWIAWTWDKKLKKEKPCKACLAGCALLNGKLDVSDAVENPSVKAMIDSLDCMRLGTWYIAYSRFYNTNPFEATEKILGRLPKKCWHGEIVGKNRVEFLKIMKKIAGVLIKNKI